MELGEPQRNCKLTSHCLCLGLELKLALVAVNGTNYREKGLEGRSPKQGIKFLQKLMCMII